MSASLFFSCCRRNGKKTMPRTVYEDILRATPPCSASQGAPASADGEGATLRPFRFKLSEETQKKLAALGADIAALEAEVAALGESEAQLLQPVFQRLLGILGCLGDDLVLVKGDIEIKPATAPKD